MRRASWRPHQSRAPVYGSRAPLPAIGGKRDGGGRLNAPRHNHFPTAGPASGPDGARAAESAAPPSEAGPQISRGRRAHASRIEEKVPRRWLTVTEAADYLQVSPHTVRRLVAARRVPFVGVNVSKVETGKEPERLHVRIDLQDLDRYMVACKIVPPDLGWKMPRAA